MSAEPILAGSLDPSAIPTSGGLLGPVDVEVDI